jgi:ankyrin repeat protein
MSTLNTQYLLAAGTDKLSVMEECLANGANPFASDDEGTLFPTIYKNKFSALWPLAVQAMIRDPSLPKNFNALHLAVIHECPSTSRILLEKYPRLAEGCATNGETPLFSFSFSPSKISDQIFQTFILAGAKFDHVSKNGWTPLHVFAKHKQWFPHLKQLTESTVEEAKKIIFLKFGNELGSVISSYVGCFLNPASWNLQTNKNGQTPLHKAIQKTNHEAIEILRKITNLSLIDQSGLPLKTSLREFDRLHKETNPSCSKCTIQ